MPRQIPLIISPQGFMIRGEGSPIFDFCTGTADHDLKKQVASTLAAAGFRPVGAAGNQADLLRLLRIVQPWLAVIDVNLAPQGAAQLAALIEEDCLAAILYIGRHSPLSARYPSIPWPAGLGSLPAVAEAVCLEFARKKKMHQEMLRLRQKLAARREVERAKGLLMDCSKVSEEEAYRHLRRRSMEERRPLEEIARRVLQKE